MESVDKYLDALTTCKITGTTPKELRLNDLRRLEYEKEMDEMFQAFSVDLLAGSYSVQEFVSVTRKVEAAKQQVSRFERIVGRTESDSPMFRPIQSLFGTYKRQVEKTAELVSNVNIMKLAQAASSTAKQKTPEAEPVITPEDTPTPTIAPAPVKTERRNLNDTNTPHPREYVGFKEMEAGEHISHTTAVKMSQDPYYKSAFRYVGRGVRVDVDKLHELERQKAIDKDKPIGKNPKRGKK